MGYYLNPAAEYVSCDNDHSYTAPGRQLLWRLEELEDRLHELITQKTETGMKALASPRKTCDTCCRSTFCLHPMCKKP